MKNAKIFCLCLDDTLLKKVKNLKYIPVGLGVEKFSSEWLTDKDGENISKKAQPIRIKTIKGGDQNVLYLGMTGPHMAELSLQIQDIREKINSYYSKEVIAQIKLQRLHNTIDRNVVDLDTLQNFVNKKNTESIDPLMDIVELEHALTKMKNNLTNSRKKNEIITD